MFYGMNAPTRSPRLDAAYSAAGAALAEHLQLGDELLCAEAGDRLVEECNYTLRSRGLRLVRTGPYGARSEYRYEAVET